ncbi:MAG: preprotein translocase subunit SecE [Bdellovibrionota bacterium]|nr:preprotein translocase subunit SecE [Bdellovibrionota bacterium]
MSIIKAEDNKKWINFFVAVIAILSGFLVIRFLGQMGEWFDLEAKVPYFIGVSQGLGALIGLVVFLVVKGNEGARQHLDQVYSELVKVIWPDSESVVKSTIGILIGLSILSVIFVGVDYVFRWLLNLIY